MSFWQKLIHIILGNKGIYPSPRGGKVLYSTYYGNTIYVLWLKKDRY